MTSGLVAVLDRIELEAVLAHELAHIKRGDTVSGAIAVQAFDPLGRHLPLFARIADKVAGTGREALADIAAVGVTRYPPGLISALEKIGSAPSRRPGLPALQGDRVDGAAVAGAIRAERGRARAARGTRPRPNGSGCCASSERRRSEWRGLLGLAKPSQQWSNLQVDIEGG